MHHIILNLNVTFSLCRYESNDFCASEHGGTHLDSPVHFSKGKWSVEEIPFKNLIGKGK